MNKRIVTGIWIYPIKSLGGIPLMTGRVLPKGLEHDRRWMLIDADNRFMSQRTFPQMARFKMEFGRESFIVHYSSECIHIPFDLAGETINAEIWNDKVEVNEVGPQHSRWFSNMLGTKCRLVCFPEKNSRKVDPDYAINGEQVSLADAYPLLIIGENSLNDLNSRLKEPVPMNRFRPNIVFAGGQPYEEDNWRNFAIGLNRFSGVKPCSRCVTTATNQDTGVRGAEPLTTLATYRMRNNKVYFGQNLIPLEYNEISVGDEIVLE